MSGDRDADDPLEKASLPKEEEELIAKASDSTAKKPMAQDKANKPAKSGFPVGNEIDFGTSME
jgi:hypothetical protein